MRTWMREYRKKAKLTQAGVATCAGISQNHYSNIEKGNRRPSPEVAKRIAALLNFDWTRFYDDTDKTD